MALPRPFPFDVPPHPADEYNPMNIEPSYWSALPREIQNFVRRSPEKWGDPKFKMWLINKARAFMRPDSFPFDPNPALPVPMTATEIEARTREYMKKVAPPLLVMDEAKAPLGDDVKFNDAGITIAYNENGDNIVVTLKLPTATVAGTTMPENEKKLFDSMMKSRRISDQLLGLEALVRHEETRLADAAKKEREAE